MDFETRLVDEQFSLDQYLQDLLNFEKKAKSFQIRIIPETLRIVRFLNRLIVPLFHLMVDTLKMYYSWERDLSMFPLEANDLRPSRRDFQLFMNRFVEALRRCYSKVNERAKDLGIALDKMSWAYRELCQIQQDWPDSTPRAFIVNLQTSVAKSKVHMAFAN